MSQKAAADFLASIRILEANIRLFQDGLLDMYRVVATELRKLLCDGKSTLLPRVFEEVGLHKFHFTHMLELHPSLAEGLQILLPGQLVVRDGIPRFRLKFATTMEQMPLEQWLDQPFLGPTLSVREFLRSVANKEGAHYDPKYNETLVRAKMVHYVTDESHLHCVVGIAEYLLEFLRREPLQVRPGIPLHRTASGDWENAVAE